MVRVVGSGLAHVIPPNLAVYSSHSPSLLLSNVPTSSDHSFAGGLLRFQGAEKRVQLQCRPWRLPPALQRHAQLLGLARGAVRHAKLYLRRRTGRSVRSASVLPLGSCCIDAASKHRHINAMRGPDTHLRHGQAKASSPPRPSGASLPTTCRRSSSLNLQPLLTKTCWALVTCWAPLASLWDRRSTMW